MSAKMLTFDSREDWLKGRTRIGGSDAAAILGLNPYTDNQKLWAIKTGKVKAEDISNKSLLICDCVLLTFTPLVPFFLLL